MDWQDYVSARFAGLVEGTYPATPVTGRSIAAGTFKPTRLHGDLEDRAFPAVHFAGGYRLALEDLGPVEAFNARAGFARWRTRVVVSVGYLFGRDAPARAAGVGSATRSAQDTGAGDVWRLVNALCFPDHWGTLVASPLLGLYGVTWVGSTVRVLSERDRLLRDVAFDAFVHLVPGAVYT